MIHDKDPAIKLFGRTIPVVERREVGTASVDDAVRKIESQVESKGRSKAPVSEDQIEPGLPLVLTIVDSKEDERETEKEDERETEKTLKRPDKILHCPRCNSLDTKFCYYNNYNVNQPRHFCKNCQRYWTAGGTMRNVPVGAGRRRSKPSPPPPPELDSRGFPSWDLERESSESGSSFSLIRPPWIKESPILPSSTSPPCSLERESPNFYLGSAPLTLTSWVNHPDAPGSSSSLGKHSRENAGSEKISSLTLKTVRVNDSRGASRGSRPWVNPDAAEAIEKQVSS